MIIKRFSWLLSLTFLTGCGGSDDFVEPVNSENLATEEITPAISVQVTSGRTEARKTLILVELSKQGRPDRYQPVRLSNGDRLTATINGETIPLEPTTEEFPEDYGVGKYTAETTTIEPGTEIQIAFTRETETPAENTLVEILAEPEFSVTSAIDSPTIDDEIEIDWTEELDYHYHLSVIIWCGAEDRSEGRIYYSDTNMHAEPPVSFAVTDIIGWPNIESENCYVGASLKALLDQSEQLAPVFTDGSVYSGRTRYEQLTLGAELP